MRSENFYHDVYEDTLKDAMLHLGRNFGNQAENGKMMFIYQAQLAFKIWHNLLPKVDDKLLD